MKLEAQVALAPRTTLGVGGRAAHYARVESDADLREALAYASASRIDLRVLGGGSNVVVADAGYAGLVIEMATRGIAVTERGGVLEVRAAAGEPWDDFVAELVARNYQGLECLSGIPGRVGATPIQNVGAYGQDVSDTIASVQTFDRVSGADRIFNAEECQFAYRDSFFKRRAADRYVVTHVTFRLRPDATPTLRYAELERRLAEQGSVRATLADVRNAVLELRRSKSMVLDASDSNTRSCGSFFVNPVLGAQELTGFLARAASEGSVPQFPQADGHVKLSAGWLIEHAGFARGTRDGAVGLSSKHALALVAYEGAQARDIRRLADRIQRGVHGRFGVRLEPEPIFW